MIERIVAAIGRVSARIAAAGGTSGAWSSARRGSSPAATGTVVASPNLPGWHDVPLRDRVAAALGLPVLLENDANAAAFGEYWRGAGQGCASMVLLTLGTGVGGGLVLGGELWRGADGMAGEIGHITVEPGGRTCRCGNAGCLETYASATGIVDRYRELSGGRGERHRRGGPPPGARRGCERPAVLPGSGPFPGSGVRHARQPAQPGTHRHRRRGAARLGPVHAGGGARDAPAGVRGAGGARPHRAGRARRPRRRHRGGRSALARTRCRPCRRVDDSAKIHGAGRQLCRNCLS